MIRDRSRMIVLAGLNVKPFQAEKQTTKSKTVCETTVRFLHAVSDIAESQPKFIRYENTFVVPLKNNAITVEEENNKLHMYSSNYSKLYEYSELENFVDDLDYLINETR